MYVCNVSMCQPGWTVRQAAAVMARVCARHWIPQHRSGVNDGERDIHTKGQAGRIREQSCLKRPLFLIKTSRVLLSTSLPLSPTGISECLMMCQPPASSKSVKWRNCR